MTSKRRGSGGNTGSTKTELDQKRGINISCTHQMSHISCMLWLLTITSFSWSYRTSAITDSVYMHVMKAYVVILLFRNKYMLVCAIQMFLLQSWYTLWQ